VSTQEDRLKALEEQMVAVQKSVADFSESQRTLMQLTQQISKDTSEIVGAWNDTKAAFRLFNILVSFFWGIMKYVVLPILVLIALVYGLGHTGEVPSWLKNAVKLILG
jgi:hypothetical protein